MLQMLQIEIDRKRIDVDCAWRGGGWLTLQVHPPPHRPPSATRLRPWKGTLRPALAAPLPRRALLQAAVAAAPGVEAV
jgi:hypothetical protein